MQRGENVRVGENEPIELSLLWAKVYEFAEYREPIV